MVFVPPVWPRAERDEASPPQKLLSASGPPLPAPPQLAGPDWRFPPSLEWTAPAPWPRFLSVRPHGQDRHANRRLHQQREGPLVTEELCPSDQSNPQYGVAQPRALA